MKKEKIEDFRPTHLKTLRFKVEKLILQKEKEQKKIITKIKKVFKF